MQPLTLAVQNAMPPRDMGVATASATFFRQMGGTLGTAVFLSILFAALPTRIVENFRAAATDPAFTAALRDPAVLDDPANQPVLSALQGGGVPNLDDSSFLSTVDPVLARPILEGFASSMSTVFLTAAAVLVLGLFAVLRMKEVPLRTQSGVEAQRELAPEASAVAQAATATTVAAPVAPVTPPTAPRLRRERGGAPGHRRAAAVAEERADGRRRCPDGRPAGPRAGVGSLGNGSTGTGQLGNGQLGNGQLGERAVGNGRSANGHGMPTGIADGARRGRAAGRPAWPRSGSGPGRISRTCLAEPAPRAAVDARDRLLAMLLPDPPRALALIAAAEQARDAARHARRMLADHTRDLDRARAELAAQGLSPAQVGRLLELTVEESPEHGGRHREARAPVPPSAN